MLKLIFKQTNWGIIGSIFGFSIGFLVKIYLIDIVGIAEWGKYVAAHAFASAADTFLAIGIPWILIKYIPNYLERDIPAANQIIRKSIRYAIIVSLIFLVVMYFIAPLFDAYIYKEIDGFSLTLLLVSVYAPIAIFTGIITSLYRSVLKIREIIIYGTFVSVPIRAILTFFVFQYTDNIIYFIGIELFTTSLTFILLMYFFNKNEFSIFFIKKDESFRIGNEIKSYGKRMYANSLISFFAGQSLSLILSIMLPPKQIGIYSILLTITGISMFFRKNLNKIFAPAITKLHEERNINELNKLYKKTTFIINLLTVPLAIIIIIFANEILYLFDNSGNLSDYTFYLYVLMVARIISLLAGSSGIFMVMGGLEKEELRLQTLKAILITFLALILINKYELLAIVALFVFFTIFINVIQLVVINKYLKISPFSKNLFLLILVSIPMLFFALHNQIEFHSYHYFLLPILVYLFYGLMFIKPIRSTYFEIVNND